MRTFTFAGGTISPGFVLSKNEKDGRNEQVLALGEYGRGSWLTNIPLNSNPENRPDVDNNIVMDTFLLNVGGQRPFFVMLRDRGQNNGSCLVRFLTVGGEIQGDGYVRQVTGFRSKMLVSGHGRNSVGGTWTDEVWVVSEGELVKVQLAGGEKAYAVRVRNGEPIVEFWIEREPRRQTTKAWSLGVGEVQSQLTELDQELEEMGHNRVTRFHAKYHQQPVAA